VKPILYGISNCDTVRKARAWLDSRGIAYDFHDYRKGGLDPSRLAAWAAELGWEKLLNRSGTTFRKLPDADKEGLDEGRALVLMLASPSMIRRPLIDLGDRRLIGFDENVYARAFEGRG
jgi:arsenate reductase